MKPYAFTTDWQGYRSEPEIWGENKQAYEKICYLPNKVGDSNGQDKLNCHNEIIYHFVYCLDVLLEMIAIVSVF